jgi:hypothetical protein
MLRVRTIEEVFAVEKVRNELRLPGINDRAAALCEVCVPDLNRHRFRSEQRRQYSPLSHATGPNQSVSRVLCWLLSMIHPVRVL